MSEHDNDDKAVTCELQLTGLSQFPYMAHDELFALQYADSDAALAQLSEQMERRRSALDDFSRARLSKLSWLTQDIQNLFDYLDLPLVNTG